MSTTYPATDNQSDMFWGLGEHEAYLSPPGLMNESTSSPCSSNVSPELSFINVAPTEATALFDEFCYPKITEELHDPFLASLNGEPSELGNLLGITTKPIDLSQSNTSLPTGILSQQNSVGEVPVSVVHITPESQTRIPRVVKQTNAKLLERRARNTEAARRSRKRAKGRIQELEDLVSQLQRENESLKGSSQCPEHS